MGKPAKPFEQFEEELASLVDRFSRNLPQYKGPEYNEARLRDDFLNPFFAALGWDVSNRAGLIQSKREVEIESTTRIGSAKKRADYLFRADGRDRFVCEAKKPREQLGKPHVFQVKRYAWNKDLPFAVLTDLEEIKFFIVGSRPDSEEPAVGELKTLHFLEYAKNARFLWDHLSRESVGGGFIDRLIDTLPKKAAGKGRLRQGYLIKPDRNRALDVDFLNFLDEARKELASSLVKHNDREALFADGRLNAATQKILDRILFLRICEDRDIDTGVKLESLVDTWEKHTARPVPERRSLIREDAPACGSQPPGESLYRRIVRHFRELDRRPPSHVPFFNGQLFKKDPSEDLEVGDDFLINFIRDLSDENSPYLFNVIPVEILGSVYERFLGKVVRPQGRGVTVEEKPEVRKAGGVYYTPRYIVDYIVEQTVGKLLDGIGGDLKSFSAGTGALRFLDPACGSGSFLIRAFERTCEHWEKRFTDDLPPKEDKAERAAWEKKHRRLCWVDPESNTVHLTVELKRRILTQNIYGVDLDSAAVEVTQLSLYLKMLENENRTTLQHQREMLADESDIALLPPLQDNIKCGNSLIASDFSMIPEDLVRVNAFDWPVQFAPIMKAGGFDAVVGNPPYIRIQRIAENESDYLFRSYQSPTSKMDLSLVFLEKGLKLVKKNGRVSFICTSQWLAADYGRILRKSLSDGRLHQLVDFGSLPVFEDASTYPSILVLCPTPAPQLTLKRVTSKEQLNLEGVIAAPEMLIPLSSLNEHPWTMGSLDIAALAASRGNPCRPLSHFGKAYIGTKCGLNEAFVLTQGEAAQARIESGILFPYAYRGGEVDRYMPVEPESVIIYPYESGKNGAAVLLSEQKLKSKYPNAYTHLLKSKKRLRERQDSRKFYARGADWYRHLRAGTFNHIRSAKLALKGIALRCSVGLLPKNTAFDGARCPSVILENLRGCSTNYFLGLLNSRLATLHLKAVCSPKLHGYIEFSARAVTSFPVRAIDFANPADKSRHDKLVMLVDKMLALMPGLRAATSEREKSALQNAVSATDRQIDELVYDLYGLTHEEIALVESAA